MERLFVYTIKSSDVARDKSSTVDVVISVDVSTRKPRRITDVWLADRKRIIGRMVDSEPNQTHLREYSEAIVDRELADAVFFAAQDAGVIDRDFGYGAGSNRYQATCPITGKTIAANAGLPGRDWFSGARVWYSWTGLVRLFGALVA